MINPDLLQMLCCPETHQLLTAADPELLGALNLKIASGQLRNRAGQPVKEKLDGGLVRADRHYLYPVCQDIPIMLIEEAIPLAGC